MNREFLNEAINLFDTPEKWNSFLELSNRKNEIKEQYFIKAQALLNKTFRQFDIEQNWDYIAINNYEYRWYLKEFGINSIYIYFNGNSGILNLVVDANHFDLDKSKVELKTGYFAPILNFMDRIDKTDDGWHLITEKGNFYFNSPYDGNFTDEKLAWYAGNQTEELVKQIAEKVNRIRKNPELTQLLRELNEKCKRE